MNLDNPITQLKFRRQILEGKALFKSKGIDVDFGIPYKNYYIAILNEPNQYRAIGYNTSNKNVYDMTTLTSERIDEINNQLMNKIDPQRECISLAQTMIYNGTVQDLYEPSTRS